MDIFRIIHRALAIALYIMSFASLASGIVIICLFTPAISILPFIAFPLLFMEAQATCCLDAIKTDSIVISNIFYEKIIRIDSIKSISFSNWPLYKKNKIMIQGHRWHEYYVFYEDIDLITKNIVNKFNMKKTYSMFYEHKYEFK